VLQNAVKKGYIVWQRHSLERMMERGISRETAKEVSLTGEIIDNEPLFGCRNKGKPRRLRRLGFTGKICIKIDSANIVVTS
jgi:hypothetical protein